MGEETAAVREVHERPGAVTHGAAEGRAHRATLSGMGLSAQARKAWKVNCFVYMKKDRHFVGSGVSL